MKKIKKETREKSLECLICRHILYSNVCSFESRKKAFGKLKVMFQEKEKSL